MDKKKTALEAFASIFKPSPEKKGYDIKKEEMEVDRTGKLVPKKPG